MQNAQSEIELLRVLLAQSQAREKVLREVMTSVICDHDEASCFYGSEDDRSVIANALSLPAGDTALREYVKGIEAERDAFKKDAARYRWQPIETAPKDGTPLLLRSRKGRVADGVWMEANSSVGDWIWSYVLIEPTHWMPLPESPDAAMQKGGE